MLNEKWGELLDSVRLGEKRLLPAFCRPPLRSITGELRGAEPATQSVSVSDGEGSSQRFTGRLYHSGR